MTAPSWILSPVSLTEFAGCKLNSIMPFTYQSRPILSSYSDWGEPCEELGAISAGTTPEDRMLRVLKWFIMTLKVITPLQRYRYQALLKMKIGPQGSYTRREVNTGSEKKPLNPILGEQFYGHFDSPTSGRLELVAEQVSHHPPITAFHLFNTSKNVLLDGQFAQKTSFSGKSINVKQVGHALITIKMGGGQKDETYLVTLPKLRIEGLFFGSP